MFDLHVHAAPDVVGRWGGDVDVVDCYQAAGFRGCVIKGHYDTTAGRAVTAGVGRALRVYGGIVLNRHVGGFNPVAVSAALQHGARVVWLPTADAHTQRAAGLPRLGGAGAGVPDVVYAAPPVDPTTAGPLRTIIRLVADADAVLATGHLSGPEASWVLAEARRAGLRRVLLTHPTYTVPGLTPAAAAELAAQGGHAEVTAYQLLHQPGCGPAMLRQVVEAVGYDRLVLSSDAGQPDSPPPPEALERLVDALAGEGLDRDALRAAASEIPERLVTP